MSAAGPETVSLLGLSFSNLDVAEAANCIAARPANARFGYVVTPNADHLVRLSRDPLLQTTYRNAAMCLLDSRVVAGLAGALGLRVPLVTPGSDLTEHILRHHLNPAAVDIRQRHGLACPGYPLRHAVTIVGADKPGHDGEANQETSASIIINAGERITIIGLSPIWLPALIERYGLIPPAHYNPPMGFEHDPDGFAAVIDFVRLHPTRFVFLAVGSPRQERLAAALANCSDITGTGLCIGASLEFLGGARRRAPCFMRRLCLEWLFRLAAEPRRLFRRYLIDSPVIIALLLRQRLGLARSLRRPPL